VVRKQEVQILIITDGVARFIQAEVDHERFDGEQPVVVQIPGPEGPSPDRRALLDLIRLAIGVRI
jgi:vacuolar-type H+-ATPase subunit F/Vma7